jgi:hypothetical protein
MQMQRAETPRGKSSPTQAHLGKQTQASQGKPTLEAAPVAKYCYQETLCSGK